MGGKGGGVKMYRAAAADERSTWRSLALYAPKDNSMLGGMSRGGWAALGVV